MNLFQMGWRSVLRKPLKSSLLMLVVCVISCFLFSAVACQNVSVATQDSTRQAIGAGFLLESNTSNRHTRIQEISQRIGEDVEGSLEGVHQKKLETSGGTSWQTWTDHSFETLLLNDIETIAQTTDITNYNITTAPTAVNPYNFTRISDPDNDQSYDKLGVALIGNKDMTMDVNVLSGNLTILDGRMITSTDVNACVISEELANLNHVVVGDSLQLNQTDDKESSTIYEAKIIGIYQVNQKMTPYMAGDTYRSENVIFTDLRFPEKVEGCENDPLFEKAYFQVKDVDDYETVKESIKNVDIDWKRYDLIDNNGSLETVAENFNDLQKISQVLLLVVASASFLILFLIFIFWIKSRVQEIGILLALGRGKGTILLQILYEATLISLFAVLISFLIAPKIADTTAAYLIEQQVEQADASQALEEGKVSGNEQKSKQSVTDVIIDVDYKLLIVDGIAVLCLVSVAILGAGTSILRRNPKDILSEMS